jgi:hypothetical protein
MLLNRLKVVGQPIWVLTDARQEVLQVAFLHGCTDAQICHKNWLRVLNRTWA